MVGPTNRKLACFSILLLVFGMVSTVRVANKRQAIWDWHHFSAQVHEAAHNVRDKTAGQFHSIRDAIHTGVNKATENYNRMSLQQALDSASERWKDLVDMVNTGLRNSGIESDEDDDD